jgi:aminoglycoside phosphotransferase (APT) family kinase protein
MIADPDFKYWEALLPDFAKLQIAAAQDKDTYLKIGIPNRTLEQLPELYEALLAEERRFRIGQSDGVSAEEYQRLHDLKPLIKQKCEELATYPIPQSLHHGDLHDGNIFHNGEHYLFLDWGDCSFSHPFFSLRTAYVSAEIRLELEDYSPKLHRLRDAYLLGWREFGTEEQLLAAFGLAEELWALSSALIWYRSITSLDEASQAEFVHVIPSLAQEFLSFIRN